MTPDEVIQETFKILDEVVIGVLQEPFVGNMPGVVKAEMDHAIRARFRYRVSLLINPLPTSNLPPSPCQR